MPGAILTETDFASSASTAASAPGLQAPGSRSAARTSLLILGLVMALYLAMCLRLLHSEFVAIGQITYPLDDTYITMAMAKNLALHGTWGITPGRFGPASSCPGYLLLLAAAYRITGPTVWWPLVLSIGFGLLALFAAWRLLREVHPVIQALALAAIVIFTPLDILSLLGMEHAMHLALTLLFLDAVGRALAERRDLSWGALLLAAAMVSARYEGLFVAGMAALLFLAERRIRAAFALGAAAGAPVVIYAVASVLHGGYWLPNSIAMKGASVGSALQAPLSLAQHFRASLFAAPWMGMLLVALLALLALPAIRLEKLEKRACVILKIVLGATLIHLTLADVGWRYRYEAYLIAAALAAVAFGLGQLRISRDRWLGAGAMLFAAAAVWMLWGRASEAERTLAKYDVAVYYQQIQMARFLARYEKGAVVAANDVGAINYYADIDCLDLVGLGDRDVFRLKRQGTYTTANLAKLAADRGVQIAILYDSWFSAQPVGRFPGPALPPSWIRVARWHTPFGDYLGSQDVSFYAVDSAEARKLADSLALFAGAMPSSIRVSRDFHPTPGAGPASPARSAATDFARRGF